MIDLIKIKIIFENCESILIDKNQMKGFYLSDITEKITLISNALLCYKHAGESYLSLDWNKVKDLKIGLGGFEKSLGERLKSKDITHYHLYTTDHRIIEIHLPWGNEDYTNTKEEHQLEDNCYIITHKD